MAQSASGATDAQPTTAPKIEGPIAEYDRYDRHTGAFYFRCKGCDTERMSRGQVEADCTCGTAEGR